ncbi:Rieske (2Fe-2S) protein [Corynebacterium kutscheri]|nr:Rieske (2Fe-2S) protein [Corynebacterium kutscheri]
MSESPMCSRRMFLLGTATTFAGALLTACGGENPPTTVAADDVPVGGAIIVDSFIIAQPTAGEYKAYSTACTHQNGVIDRIEGQVAICPKHNSHFSIVDGSVIEGLARDPLIAKTITHDGDTLELS